mgnify:CR=1 FL=1
MSIKRGTREVAGLYRGTRAVERVYRGTQEVYSAEEPVRVPTVLTLHLTSTLAQTLRFTQSAANGVTIDWGDGSEPETVAGTINTETGATVYLAEASHTYAAAGDYTVTMTAGSGVTWGPGVAGQVLIGVGFLGQKSNKSDTYPQLTSFVIGSGCTALYPAAFCGCTALTSMEIPQSVTEIGWNAFRGCTGLAEVSIPASVASFGTGAAASGFGAVFYDCTALRNVEIAAPEAGCAEAFIGCSALEKVWIRSTVDSILPYSYTNKSDETYHYGLCTGANQSAVLYCEDTAAQPGWQSFWDKRDITTETSGYAVFEKVFGQTVRPW